MFPDIDCTSEKENAVYYYCGPLVEPTCLDILTGSSPTPDAMCTEGCFCPEDMVTDGNRCVSEDECGCVYEGEYYQVGTTIVQLLDVENYTEGSNFNKLIIWKAQGVQQ